MGIKWRTHARKGSVPKELPKEPFHRSLGHITQTIIIISECWLQITSPSLESPFKNNGRTSPSSTQEISVNVRRLSSKPKKNWQTKVRWRRMEKVKVPDWEPLNFGKKLFSRASGSTRPLVCRKLVMECWEACSLPLFYSSLTLKYTSPFQNSRWEIFLTVVPVRGEVPFSSNLNHFKGTYFSPVQLAYLKWFSTFSSKNKELPWLCVNWELDANGEMTLMSLLGTAQSSVHPEWTQHPSGWAWSADVVYTGLPAHLRRPMQQRHTSLSLRDASPKFYTPYVPKDGGEAWTVETPLNVWPQRETCGNWMWKRTISLHWEIPLWEFEIKPRKVFIQRALTDEGKLGRREAGFKQDDMRRLHW